MFGIPPNQLESLQPEDKQQNFEICHLKISNLTTDSDILFKWQATFLSVNLRLKDCMYQTTKAVVGAS